MNSTIDQIHHWLNPELQDMFAVQTQLRKGLRPIAAKRSPSATQLPRYPLTHGVFAIPILHDASPDTARCGEGITIDLSAAGITFELAVTTRPASPKWLLGLERNDGTFGFITVVSHSVRRAGLGLLVSAEIVTPNQDPLSAANLTPFFDPQSFAFRTKLPPAVLDQWVALGVMQPRVLDRVLVCPSCNSLPTFRHGCRACGSIDVVSHRLIHHFACAHVDHVASFEHDTEMTCPKCRVRKLVVGADFEFLDGPFRCRDCNWSDTELAAIARCVACGHEFAANEAAQKELIGYHVERLEPLDLIAAN